MIKPENKFQFKSRKEPADYPADRRREERRLIVVNSTRRALHHCLFAIFILVTVMSISGVVVYARFEDLNRKLMVEVLSEPPIDISIDQPDVNADVEAPPERRSR